MKIKYGDKYNYETIDYKITRILHKKNIIHTNFVYEDIHANFKSLTDE